MVIIAATNSHPYVAVSTVGCLLEYQSVGVPLMMWRMAVTALPVTKAWGMLWKGRKDGGDTGWGGG